MFPYPPSIVCHAVFLKIRNFIFGGKTIDPIVGRNDLGLELDRSTTGIQHKL